MRLLHFSVLQLVERWLGPGDMAHLYYASFHDTNSHEINLPQYQFATKSTVLKKVIS